MKITLISPLRVPKSKTKYFSLNLNVYRNSHYQVLNKSKVEYKKLMFKQVSALPVMKKISITYTLYPGNKRLCDLDNILSIIAKYFQDTLVELGKLPEDNYLFIPETLFRFGVIDKNNPHCKIKIEEL